MKIVWDTEAWDDYLNWLEQDRKIFNRINDLLKECRRSPFSGLGKPEALRNELKGWWSRRINREDRLVYRVRGTKGEQVLEIIYCKGHYL